MMQRSPHRLLTPTFQWLAILSLLASGCSKPAPHSMDMAMQAVMAKVVRQPIVEGVSLVGNLEADDQADLVSELDAHVTAILFQEGQRVTNGQPLIVLDNSRSDAQLAAAESEVALRAPDLARATTLLANGTMSQQEFDRIQAADKTAQANLLIARVNSDDATIRAPFDGFVANHNISVGTYVHRGEVLSSVVKTDLLKVSFNVPERYSAALQPDQSIHLTASSSTNVYTGTVYFVSPRVDEKTRTILVKAKVLNAGGELRPGMFGRLELVLNTRENALTIPEASVKYGNNAAMVVVGTPATNASPFLNAEFRPITVGARMKDTLEVVSGLSEGEFVVVEGHQKMGPGAKIKISAKSERYGVIPPAEPTPETPKAE